MSPLLLQVFLSDHFFMHAVLRANASPSGFVPQVRTKVPFPLLNFRICRATELPLRDINPNAFLECNKLFADIHRVLSLGVSPLWCLLKGDARFCRSVVGLKETCPRACDCNSLLLRRLVPCGVVHIEGQSCPLGRAGFQVC